MGLALLLTLEYPAGRTNWDKTAVDVCRVIQGMQPLYERGSGGKDSDTP